MHEFSEFFWLVLAQLVDRGLFLLLLNGGVLLSLGSAWQALPREGALQEVEQHVANRLQVVSPRLFVA